MRTPMTVQDWLAETMNWRAEYFSAAAMIRSREARHLKLDNLPTLSELQVGEAFAVDVLDAVRAVVDQPVLVSSFFRGPELNASDMVRGAPDSLHQCTHGAAADIYVLPRTDETMQRLMAAIAAEGKNRGGGIVFDELIIYSNPARLHIQRRISGENRFKLLRCMESGGTKRYPELSYSKVEQWEAQA